MVTEGGSRTVCVLGFHRSGTSLTARILNILGVDLGDEHELLEPSETDNPRGYWEPRWVNELNDEVLGAFGVQWWQPFSAPAGWEETEAMGPLRMRARDLLDRKLTEAPLHGIKDPRLSLTLPLWRPLLARPTYLVCLRNPVDAVASMQRRPEPTLPTRAWGELWLEYTARALQATAGEPRMLVFYEDYFDDSRRLIADLATLVGVSETERDTRLQQAHDEIAKDLRRHVTTARELAGDPATPAAARTLFLALKTAHIARRTKSKATDELIDAIERAAPDLWWTSRQAVSHAAATVALEDARAALVEMTAALAARSAELAGVAAKGDAQAEQLATRTAALETARVREQELAEQLAVAQRETAVERSAREQLLSSRSWRLTAPLRRAALLLRRGPTARAGDATR